MVKACLGIDIEDFLKFPVFRVKTICLLITGGLCEILSLCESTFLLAVTLKLFVFEAPISVCYCP